jgi:hypothetical protein
VKKRIAYLLILMLVPVTIGGKANAMTNIEIAANRLIERYPETHILPSTGLGIFIGESGGGHNNGRYYGNMSRRIYDIEDSTDQFIDLMLKYGNVARQRSWIGQVYVLQSHGYYGGSSAKYIRYIMSIVERRGLTRYDDKARAYEARLVEEKAAKKRKKRQLETFTLVPANIPVGTIKTWTYKSNHVDKFINLGQKRGRKKEENLTIEDYKEQLEIIKKYQVFPKAQ